MPVNDNFDAGGNRDGHPQSMVARAAAQRSGHMVNRYDR
jgi:hypothetical protein